MKAILSILLVALQLVGCQTPHPVGKALPVEHEDYVRHAIEKVDYEVNMPAPDAQSPLLGPGDGANREFDQPWPMVLFSAIHVAMQNTKVIKQDAQFLASSNPLHFNIEAPASSLDPDIQAANINFGNRGVAAALSDFAPRLSGNAIWGHDETVQNSLFSGGLTPGEILDEDSANVLLRLEKQLAWGGQVTVDHNIDYSANNVPSRLFPSTYSGAVSFNYTQPLWAGAGTEFTQISGPVSLVNQRILSVNQGVLIARIDGELARLEFEQTVNQLVKEVTDAYWDLTYAHQSLKIEQESLKRLEQIWESERTDLRTGRSTTAVEAEAADAYYSAVARVEDAQSQVNSSEIRLRRLMNLPAHDGRIITPVEDPMVTIPPPDYTQSLVEALGRRPELRRTKWQVRSLHLQLKAARSLMNPRVDFQAGYRVNGFGDDLLAETNADGVTTQGYKNFYGDLARSNATGWNLGLVFAMPIGFPQERAQVRNLELRIAKAQAVVAAQETEISHELTYAHQQVQRWDRISTAYVSRAEAARRRLSAVEAEFEADRANLTALLEARLSYLQAQQQHQRALSERSKALAEIHYRKGSLLDLQQVAIQFDQSQLDQPQFEQSPQGPVTPLPIEPISQVLPAEPEQNPANRGPISLAHTTLMSATEKLTQVAR